MLCASTPSRVNRRPPPSAPSWQRASHTCLMPWNVKVLSSTFSCPSITTNFPAVFAAKYGQVLKKKKKKRICRKTLRGKGGLLPAAPGRFLLSCWLGWRHSGWSLSRLPGPGGGSRALRTGWVAGNQIPKDFRKRENGGQTRRYRVVKNQKRSSACWLLLPWLPATRRQYC